MKPSCVTLSDGDDGWIGLLAVVWNAVLVLTKMRMRVPTHRPTRRLFLQKSEHYTCLTIILGPRHHFDYTHILSAICTPRLIQNQLGTSGHDEQGRIWLCGR